MKNQSGVTRFIICGAHITENLEHHKTNDVKRILEEKGFSQAGDANGTDYSYTQESGSDSGKRTIISFDEGGFVRPGDGVQVYDSPEEAAGSLQ